MWRRGDILSSYTLWFQASVARDTHQDAYENWTKIDHYERAEHQQALIKNYNLMYSFYKNVYSWGFIRAPAYCSQVTGALTNTGLIYATYSTRTDSIDYNPTELDSDITNHGNLSTDDSDDMCVSVIVLPPKYCCKKCCKLRLYNKNYSRFGGGFTPVETVHCFVPRKIRGKQLFYSEGQNRKKLMLKYGFSFGLKYR